MSQNNIVISHNHWRIPDPKRAFAGWLEGCPTPQQRQQTIAEAEDARRYWTPSLEAMALAQQLKSFVGCRVVVQLWHPEMSWHELEGPFPFNAVCLGVDVRQEREFTQAFLRCSDIIEVPNAIGFSPSSYFQKAERDKQDVWVSLADLYEISKIGSKSA